jgi:hypothetical protein
LNKSPKMCPNSFFAKTITYNFYSKAPKFESLM